MKAALVGHGRKSFQSRAMDIAERNDQAANGFDPAVAQAAS
jgi:hypothetical protein